MDFYVEVEGSKWGVPAFYHRISLRFTLSFPDAYNWGVYQSCLTFGWEILLSGSHWIENPLLCEVKRFLKWEFVKEFISGGNTDSVFFSGTIIIFSNTELGTMEQTFRAVKWMSWKESDLESFGRNLFDQVNKNLRNGLIHFVAQVGNL